MSNCRPLEVVGRGSETQLQVGENLNAGNVLTLSTLMSTTVDHSIVFSCFYIVLNNQV